jgi:hypothetical protein
VDVGGAEASRFGARTSGYVLLYDASGKLTFQGGITGSRGHAGENIGRRTLQRILDAEPGPMHEHAVYGCALLGEGAPGDGARAP